jgi:deoxyadenosine/deoxycytidine kinase
MKASSNHRPLSIGVVGPCKAGKSTLINHLREKYPIEIRDIAQDHSYVPDMWQRINRPDWLVFLDVSYAVSMQRKELNWTVEEYQEQQRRLNHARQNANLYLFTDHMTADQVASQVEQFINGLGIEPIH